MKKIISVFIAVLLAVSPFTVACASNDAEYINLSLYCNRYDAESVSGKYKKGVFFLPADTLCLMIGAEITEVSNQKVTIYSERYMREVEISFLTQKMTDKWAESKKITMPSYRKNGEVFISALHFLRYFGATVKIDQNRDPQLIVYFKYNLFEAVSKYTQTDNAHYFGWDEAGYESGDINKKIANAGLVALVNRDSNIFRLLIDHDGIKREAIEEVLSVIVKNEGQNAIKDKSVFAQANEINDFVETGKDFVEYVSEFEEMKLSDKAVSKLLDDFPVSSVAFNALNALESMEQFTNISNVQMNLLENTMINHKEDSEFLCGEGEIYYDAAVKVNDRVKSQIANHLYANMEILEKNFFDILEDTVTNAITVPVGLAWDVLMAVTGLVANGPINQKTDLDNANNCSKIQMIANEIYLNAFERLSENDFYCNDITEQENLLNQVKSSLILQIKSTITTRQYLLKSRYPDEAYQRDMEEMLEEAVVLLNKLENCKIVPVGVAPVVDDDLSWMAEESEEQIDSLIDRIVDTVNSLISGEEPETEKETEEEVEIKSYGYAETVMDSLDEWEFVDGDFCRSIQLYEIDGNYYMYCLYTDEPDEKINNTVSTYYIKVTYRYLVTEDSFGSREKTETPMYDGILGLKNLVGSSSVYGCDTYEEKYDRILHLFNELYEQGLEE